MIISETIKAIRNELKMTQTDFAEAVHVSFSKLIDGKIIKLYLIEWRVL